MGQVDDLLQWIDSKLQSPTSLKVNRILSECPLSSSPTFHTNDILENPNIEPGIHLQLKPNYVAQVEESKKFGADAFMSSENTHKFLAMLLDLISRPTEASARTWVDAFLYRASAMMPADRKMVINLEYRISPVTVQTDSGHDVVLVRFTDYKIIVAPPDIA
ncbi:hypothetical protein H0H93_001814, partial [Arthromyces matolae]